MTPGNHGGPRQGAGRRPTAEPMPHTVQVRMGAELYDHVTELSAAWQVDRPEVIRRILRHHIDTRNVPE